jgi:tetratricopeptide (TPR) repeat protein
LANHFFEQVLFNLMEQIGASTRPPHGPAIAWERLLGALLTCLLLSLPGCSQYRPFDSAEFVRSQLGLRVGAELRDEVEVPFELDAEIRQALGEQLDPGGGEKRRTEEILDFIFRRLGLRYSLPATRSAVETFRSREGNCLSFVNLFVGIARHRRLNAFYVEVEDYQRWNYQDGIVVSRGHIVAGMYVDGSLSTFDFLPYRPKSYRRFQPIDDLTATAHYYNNLAAAALLEGDLERAQRLGRVAAALAPEFEKALNNLGLILLRAGDLEGAVETLRRGLELHPESVPLMTNLALAYQRANRPREAAALLAKLETVSETSPFFFLYLGERALAEGNPARALEHMREALRRDSELPEVHVGLVETYLALGDLERARHHVQRALTLDATHLEARRYAALLQDRLDATP